MDNLRASKTAVVDFKATDANVALELSGLEGGVDYTLYMTAEDKKGERLMFDTQVISLSFKTPNISNSLLT